MLGSVNPTGKAKPRVLVLPKTAVGKPYKTLACFNTLLRTILGISSLRKRLFHTSQKFCAIFFLLPLFFASSALAEDLRGRNLM